MFAGPYSAPQDTLFLATNEAWVEAARVLRVPVLSLVTGIFPSSFDQIREIVEYNIGTSPSPGEPVSYDFYTNPLDTAHALTTTGRETPGDATTFQTALSINGNSATVFVVVDDWTPELRSFRVRAQKAGVPEVSTAICWADTKITVPNIFLCNGNLGGFVYNHLKQAYDLIDPIPPSCPVVHVTSRLLLPNSCAVFPTVQEVVCSDPNLSLYCAAYLLTENEFPTPLSDLEQVTVLAGTNFAWTQAFITLGLFSPLVVNKVDYINPANLVLIKKLILYNIVNSPLPQCVLLPSPAKYDTLLDFDDNFVSSSGTPLPITFERRSALERLCGGSIYGRFIFERKVFIGQLNSASVLAPGINACAGNTVYVTDAVLIPPDLFSTRTVLDIVNFKATLPGSRYTIFANWVSLSPTFSALYAAEGQSSSTFHDGITVIIPTNKGIRDFILYLKAGDVPYALQGLLSDQDPLLIEEVLQYHTIQGAFYFNNLLTLDGAAAETFVPGGDDDFETVSINILGTYPHEIIQIIGACSSANVIRYLSDQAAVNGVVHVLDSALVPPSFCRSACSLIEINPLTNVFIALVYALGMEKDFCELGCFTGSSDGQSATWLVPTDVAFTSVFAYLGLPQNTIFEYPALLYDIVLYHIIADITVLSTQLTTGSTAVPILGRYTAAGEGFPELEFIRVDTEDVQGWHFTTLYVQGQEFENPPARVIIPDQIATDGVVHTINRVLLPSTARTCATPGLVYVDGDCDDIPCTITGLFPAVDVFSAEAVVTYVPDPTCIPWCLAKWCFPCTPLAAQPIVTLGGLNETFGASLLDDPLGQFLNILNRGNVFGGLSLYINQVGELRLGIAPYFDLSFFESDHVLDITNAPSIYAAGFTAFPYQTYKILATYSQPCGIAKIYVNDIIRAVAHIDFDLNFQNEFVIVGGQNPRVRTRPGVTPFTGEVSGQFANYGGPYPDGQVPIFYNPFGIATVSGFGPGSANFVEIANTYDYVGNAATLIDGIPGWSRIEGTNPLPDYLKDSAYFLNCGSSKDGTFNPKYDQCEDSSPKNACCGLSAVDYREWLGLIQYVYLFAEIIYPSACTYPVFLPTAIPGSGPVDLPEVEIEVPPGEPIPPGTELVGEAPGGERIVEPEPFLNDPFLDPVLQNPLNGGGVLNPFNQP